MSTIKSKSKIQAKVQAKPKPKYILTRGRDAGNGQFISIEEAKKKKKTATVDKMKVY